MQADPNPAVPRGSEPGADTMEPALLAVSGLSCARNDVPVFRDLVFSLSPGQILLVEGENGSGKTTLLRILCGLLEPESGDIRWRGSDIRGDYGTYLRNLCYIGHGNGIKPGLTPRENLDFTRDLSAAGSVTGPEAILKRFGLERFSDRPAQYLSAGQRRRLALGRLLLERKSLWLLDEPFTALDEEGRRLLRGLFSDHLDDEGSVIMTSHDPFTGDGLPVQRLQLQ